MITTKELINEAISLPIEEKAHLVDSILLSMNSPGKKIENKWIRVAKSRLDELRSGKVKGIPGEEVFAKIRERFIK